MFGIKGKTISTLLLLSISAFSIIVVWLGDESMAARFGEIMPFTMATVLGHMAALYGGNKDKLRAELERDKIKNENNN